MPLYACVNCNRNMTCKKNEVNVIEIGDFGAVAIWWADLWICPSCSHEILGGFGLQPWTLHYEEGFAEHLKRAKDNNPYYILLR